MSRSHYSRLSLDQITSICQDFGIDHIQANKILSGGSENTNYLITADCGKYVLTICEQKTEQQAKELTALLEHLETHNFKTSKIVKNKNGEAIQMWQGKPIMVKEFIDGKVVDDLTPTLLHLIGKEMAQLHKTPAPSYLPDKIDYGKERFHEVKKYAEGSAFEKWLLDKLDDVLPYFKLDLPKALIHSDIFDNNVIINDDESSVTIMDFEEACHYYRVFDIGMAIIGSCREGKTVNFEKARALLTGYLSELTLTHDELQSLQAFTVYAGAAMTFWRHINFNYTKPDPKMFNHYLGLKVLTDDVQKWGSDCFLHQI